jgi:hypothetical protein
VRYEFSCDECGHAEVRDHGVEDRPAIGSKRPCPACRGHTLTRVYSLPQVSAAVAVQAHGYPYVSRQHSGLPGTQQTPEGHSVIRSARHEREVIKRAADQGRFLYRE